MDMGSARLIKKASYEDIIGGKGGATDGANSFPVTRKTVYAAIDVHEAISAIERRKGGGLNPFSLSQFC